MSNSLTVRRWLAVTFLAVATAALIFWGCSSGLPPVKTPPPVVTPPPPNPPPTVFPYVLTSSVTSLTFSSLQGRSPFDQTIQVNSSLACPPPTGVPTCHWAVQVSADQFWIQLSTASGTNTPFPVVVSIVSQELGPGTYTGNIILTNPQFTEPTVTILVTLTVTNPPPPPPPPPTCVPPAVLVNGICRTPTPGQPQVSLSWNASGSTDVIGYNVHRSVVPFADGDPTFKMNDLRVTTLNFTDITVQTGQTYYYAVTALDADGNESVYSNIVREVIPTP